jgi:hypothetical protein
MIVRERVHHPHIPHRRLNPVHDREVCYTLPHATATTSLRRPFVPPAVEYQACGVHETVDVFNQAPASIATHAAGTAHPGDG